MCDRDRRFKYPRTPHLPFSKTRDPDDIEVDSVEMFEGEDVVITEKLDGENCNLYHDYFHARSTDSRHHPTRDWVKNLHGKIKHKIPEGMRICGENCFAVHSLEYKDLPSYFLVFNIWEEEKCLSWDETVEWCELLELEHVPVIYRGEWDESLAKNLFMDMDFDKKEGYVVRVSGEFSYQEFQNNVSKAVRPNHVQTSDHWMYDQRMEIDKNELADDAANGQGS